MSYGHEYELERWRASQAREAFLRTLPKDERTRLRREDAAKVGVERPSPDLRLPRLITLWERLRAHKLSDSRRQEFLEHPSAEKLAAIRADALTSSASTVMANNDGELRLDDWLTAAEEESNRLRDAGEVAASGKRFDELYDLPRPPPIPKCPNCGLAYRSDSSCRC